MVRRLVSVDFWTDDKVVDLFSPEDKYFMLYLLTNPHTTQLGIYKLNTKYAAFETGYSVETIKSLLNRFENHLGIIFYSPETGEIAIKNYLIYSIIKGGKPVADLLWKEINDIKNQELIEKVFEHIKDSDKINKTVRYIIENYYSAKKEKRSKKEKIHNEIYIENENDKSYHLSSDESSDESSTDVKTHPTHTQNPLDVKELHGKYKNVLLSKNEINILVNKFDESTITKAIKHLDEYIESKNYRDNNHFLCIQRWVIDAVREREQKAKRNNNNSTFHNFTQREYDMDSLERQILSENEPKKGANV